MYPPLVGRQMKGREGIPEGKFVFVSATGLLATWWAYKRGRIGFRDFRVWLASHELVAQRCRLEKGRLPRFQIDELQSLVGGEGGQHLRASVRRLQSESLLKWSETSIRQADRFDRLTEEAQAFVSRVTNHRRRIPVPRRLLRLLAAESRPVFVATAIGHLLRCMYYRNHQCSPSGLCKASWIADRLEVDERNVKAARKELEQRGVLIRDVARQTFLNRHGVPMRFNLKWEGVSRRTKTPPRRNDSATESPPPLRTGISLSRSKNQNPAKRGPHGVRKRTGQGTPRLSHVEFEDLRTLSRMLILHREAANAGIIGTSEAERLKFFAAAEHARAKGKANPCGLFVSVIRRGLWSFINQPDEDAARKMLRAVECSTSPRPQPHEAKVVPTCQDEIVENVERLRIRECIRRSLASVCG